MSVDPKHKDAHSEPVADFTDAQLEDTSAGKSFEDIIRKKGNISTVYWSPHSDPKQATLSETAKRTQDY